MDSDGRGAVGLLRTVVRDPVAEAGGLGAALPGAEPTRDGGAEGWREAGAEVGREVDVGCEEELAGTKTSEAEGISDGFLEISGIVDGNLGRFCEVLDSTAGRGVGGAFGVASVSNLGVSGKPSGTVSGGGVLKNLDGVAHQEAGREEGGAVVDAGEPNSVG